MNLHPCEMSNEALDRLAIRADRRANYQGLAYRRFDQIGSTVAKRHIIKGIFARGETSFWYAPPGGMKSALMADAAVTVPSGADWFGRRNKEACAVVYFALERADLVSRRLTALRLTRSLPDNLPIAVVSDSINFKNADSVAKVVATINEVTADYGVSVGLAIFDTFSKLTGAAGLDEDKAKDQEFIFEKLHQIVKLTDIHLAVVGHTGKDVTRGQRGSNASVGHGDLMVEISGDLVRTATVKKANDAPEGPLFSFKSEVFEFGIDEDGDPITVNIISSADVSTEVAMKPASKLSANQQTFFRLLFDAGSEGLTLDEWNSQARAVGIGASRKATLHDLRKALEDRSMVREYGGRWKVNHS
jgi:hypothetical protein